MEVKYNGRQRSLAEEKRLERKAKLQEEHTRAKIAESNARQKVHEMKLAHSQGELIPKALVTAQATYLLICLRERLLVVPGIIGRLAGLSERELEFSVSAELRMVMDEFADFPQKVVDPNWMARLAEEGDE